MIDHVSLAVSDLEPAAEFYERVFATLGLSRLVARANMIGFGKSYPEVWLNRREGMPKRASDDGAHLCLRARTTQQVDAFHAAAIAAGGASESPPSIRPHDRVKYYAAFVTDPDGNRIEAVCFPQE